MTESFFYPLVFLLAGAFGTEETGVNKYKNESLGVAFDYPETLVLDKESSREAPLSVVFSSGTSPFAVSVLFKEVMDSSDLEELISNERKKQENGSYRGEIDENRYLIQGKIPAIEFVRNAEIGTIYYFVFPSPKANKLVAFWHTTSEAADPDRNAVKAYEIMRESLKISAR